MFITFYQVSGFCMSFCSVGVSVRERESVHLLIQKCLFYFFFYSSRGSSIAKIIGHNVKANNRFDPMVNMWVYEEMIDGRKLTEIINTDHENVKYLPGHKLPKNVVSLESDAEVAQLASAIMRQEIRQMIQL